MIQKENISIIIFGLIEKIDKADKATTPSGKQQDINLNSAVWQSTIQKN